MRIWGDLFMNKNHYTCECGYSYDMSPSDGSTLRCPKCGQLVSIPSKEINPGDKGAFERFLEATYETMKEGVEGGCPFSGAR